MAEIRSLLRAFGRLPFPDYNHCLAIDELHGHLIIHDADVAGRINWLLAGREMEVKLPDLIYQLLEAAKSECGDEKEIGQYDAYIAALQKLINEVHQVVFCNQ